MDPSADIVAGLRRIGLIGPDDVPDLTPLTGGVASDIFRVTTSEHVFAVKRALEKLRVAADWRVPVSRNMHERLWLETAERIVPGSVPAVLGHDDEAGLFAMAFLDPATHPVWKAQLRAGITAPAFAAEVGRRIAAIHAATAGDHAIAARFDTTDIFRPIRLEAYLEAAAVMNPGVADRLMALSQETAARRIALVHGDVSPKNILVGPRGPVYLDAECAWYGDPAFDPAFCLNHLLLKCLWTPGSSAGFLACFDALASAYRAGVTWEDADAIEARIAALLPGLFLARVDGKSPVEYITDEADRARVRRVATRFLAMPAPRLDAIRSAWASEIAGD